MDRNLQAATNAKGSSILIEHLKILSFFKGVSQCK